MNIAAAQISCSLGDLKANLLKIRDFSAEAKEVGADLIVFPEMVDTGYSMPVIQTHATPWINGVVPELQRIAKTVSIAIVSGVAERDGTSIYNSQIFIDARGEIVTKYRKAHLFAHAPIEEHKCFSPGKELTSFAFAGLCFGLSICYDLRFPELYRKLAVENDVNSFIVSSAWPFSRIEHFLTLATARAIENQSYMIVANRVGNDDGVSFCGRSRIIDPYGVIIAAASQDREELIQAEISEDAVKSVRSQMEVFAHRRPDVYR
jgi:omega-amidase